MGRRLQQYHLLKERVMHETQLLRQRMDESRSGGNANGSRDSGVLRLHPDTCMFSKADTLQTAQLARPC